MFYGLAGRLATVIKISTDGENFTNLFKIASSETKYILSDWREKADNIVNAGKTDANMYAMYYDISTYIATSKTVYIRFGYEAIPDGVTAVDKEGADIFGGVTFYSKLDLCKVKA
ncbi:MAG TPA: hypothetical protein DDY77_01970 [Clostridiales bacterium]|nr:hypothetical protein [Clostridiales bacterium]